MGGKTSTSTSSVQVPADVLARYNSVNATAQTAASQPFQSYSSDPSAFVAPLSATQQAGIQNTNNSTGQAQPYYQAATAGLLNAQAGTRPDFNRATTLANAGSNPVNPTQIGDKQINQFMNPYLHDVVGAESGLLNQNNQQAMAGQLGNAITSGAFGGDRSGIAAANLSQQQNLANANIYSGLLNQGYNSALGAAQQQQGVNLGAQEANRAAKQWGSQQQANLGQMEYGVGANTANSLAGLGAGAQSADLQGATAQLSAGQQEQSTQQAGLTSLYNQFLQQQAYPFQTSQFLANVAEGTGSLSGSTTSTTQPTGLFGNLLSDRRAKEDIREVGKAKNGLKVYTFKYKGDPEKVTHLGFMADEVEKKHPEAVGLAGGLKTVDYDRAARADGGGLVFDPNAGEYGLGAAGTPGRSTYVPAPTQGHARTIAFQHSPPAPRSTGLTDVADQYKAAKGLYNDGSELWKDGKSVVSGLGGGNLSHGGLALARDDGGGVNDAYSHETPDDLLRKQAALHAEAMQTGHAPNSAGTGPVSGALAAQNSQPKYSLGSTPDHGGHSSGSGGGLGDLAALGTMASDVAPYALALFGLKAGGLVPEHHTDGDAVGNTLNSDEFGRPLGDVAPAAPEMGGLKGRGLPPGGGPKFEEAPQTKPYRQRPVYAEDAAPMPPERPAGLGGATPDAVAAQPGLAAPAYPTFHYQPDGRLGPRRIADQSEPSPALAGLGASPSAGAMTGLAPPNAPLNVRNNNPGNIIDGAFARGMDGYVGGDKHGFAVFNSPEAGSAAAEHNLISYAKRGLNTPAQIISRWSPPDAPGNSPAATHNYINYVASRLGVDANTPLDMADPKVRLATVGAIRDFEGGVPPGNARTAASAQSGGSSSQPQQPGLMGSLGSFLHGQPDGQSSPNGGQGERALMAVLSGLGAVGSYKGQSPLGAILQGLGAGAHGWMDSGRQQADIARTQAGTGLLGAETTETGNRAITQQAQTMHARQELVGKSKWLDPYGTLWVHTADDRIMDENQWNAAGRPALYGQGLGATSAPLSGTVSPGGAPVPPAPPQAPQAPAAPAPLVAPPSPETPPDVPFGVGINMDAAKNDIAAMKGPNFTELSKGSAQYPTQVKQGLEASQATMPYTQELAKILNQAYKDPNSAKPGAAFSARASIARIGNTLERLYGGKETFSDGDTNEEISHKIQTLRASMAAQGAGQHALGAMDELTAANPNFTQNPKASSALVAQMAADEVKARDKANHAQAYGQLSHGSYFNAANDFAANNGPQKYNLERDEYQRLLLSEPPKVVQNLMSGKYSTDQIRKQLVKGGYPETLARYFSTGG